jgi:3-oxoacyl-[acyl-carrier-protein] synthase II
MTSPICEPVAITGIGLLSGLGIGIDENWASIRSGGSAFVRSDRFSSATKGDILFAQCREFDIRTYFSDLTAPFPLYYSQLALMGCRLAIENAGLMPDQADMSRIGLIINSDLGAGTAGETYALKLYGKGPDRVSPFEFTKSVSNCAVGDVARYFGITGPSSFIIGENPLAYGFDLVSSGRADIVICGGFDEMRLRIVDAYWQRHLILGLAKGDVNVDLLNAAIARNGCADVLAPGEASSFIVLESRASAQKRKAPVYAEMVDYWTSCDSCSNEYVFNRSVEAQEVNWRGLFQRTGVSPEDVGLVFSSSALPIQFIQHDLPVIQQIWGDHPVNCTTVKGRIGEAFSGGVTASAAIATHALVTRCLPGTGFNKRFFDSVPASVNIPAHCMPIPMQQRHCLVNSVQLGGNVTSILLKR